MLATVALGYADGICRAARPTGAWRRFAGERVPFVGRVSMDLITLDVTRHSRRPIKVGDEVEFLGDTVPLDDVGGRGRHQRL